MLRLRFYRDSGGQWRAADVTTGRELIEAPENLEQAVALLRRLNTRSADGVRSAGTMVCDGFEPWWFHQEFVFWHRLAPYTRFRPFVAAALEAGGALFENAPDEFRGLLQQIHRTTERAEATPQLQLASPRRWNDAIRQWLRLSVLALLAIESLCALLWFRLSGRDTLLYAIDNVSPGLRHDFRLDRLYAELRARHYRWAEYIHVHQSGAAVFNLWRRRRPVVFYEPIAELLGATDTRRAGAHGIPADARDTDEVVLAALADEMIRRAAHSIRLYHTCAWLLKRQGVRHAVILDDSRWANELVAACRQLGIPTLGYQHGLFNRYHTGLMAYDFGGARRHAFDRYGLWTEYFRQRLLASTALYDEADTFVCGPLRPAPASLSPPVRPTPQPARILFVSEPRARQQEVVRYLERLLAEPDVAIRLKVRPGEAVPFLRGARPDLVDRVQVLRSGTVYESLADADVVIASYSTVLYEGILALRPAVQILTSFQYESDLRRDGLVEIAATPAELPEAVAKATRLSIQELERRREILWGGAPADGASTLLDVAEKELWPARQRAGY